MCSGGKLSAEKMPCMAQQIPFCFTAIHKSEDKDDPQLNDSTRRSSSLCCHGYEKRPPSIRNTILHHTLKVSSLTLLLRRLLNLLRLLPVLQGRPLLDILAFNSPEFLPIHHVRLECSKQCAEERLSQHFQTRESPSSSIVRL